MNIPGLPKQRTPVVEFTGDFGQPGALRCSARIKAKHADHVPRRFLPPVPVELARSGGEQHQPEAVPLPRRNLVEIHRVKKTRGFIRRDDVHKWATHNGRCAVDEIQDTPDRAAALRSSFAGGRAPWRDISPYG